MRVVVLYGGISEEREISHRTGISIAEALTEFGWEVHLVDTATQGWLDTVVSMKPDVVFPALHGRWGEDGRIQATLEVAGIPYVGTGVLGSVAGIDKWISKQFFRYVGFYVPEGCIYPYCRDFSISDFPLVVKPRYGGSTIGLSIVDNKDELVNAVERVKQLGDEPIVEEKIDGREMTIGAYMVEGEVHLMPIVEIRYASDVFDYKSKYTPKGAQHIISPSIPDDARQMLEVGIPALFELMHLAGVVRFDFILKMDRVYMLEVNTIPGMTRTSFIPEEARHMGFKFSDFLKLLIEDAIGKGRL